MAPHAFVFPDRLSSNAFENVLAPLLLVAKQRQVRAAAPADDEKRRVIDDTLLAHRAIIPNRRIAPAHRLKCLVCNHKQPLSTKIQTS